MKKFSFMICVNCLRRSGEGTTIDKTPSNGENDSHSHSHSQNSGHGSDNSANRVLRSVWFNNEPEKHVNHVDDPDGAVQVETITKHQFPQTERFLSAGLEGADES